MPNTKKLGIIQSRGLGDLVIALPIAYYYYQQNYTIYWPVCEEFYNSMQSAAPYIHWIPVPTDPNGDFFVREPMRRLHNFQVPDENILWLYQYINVYPERTDLNLYAQMKFDQYKYARAELPFSLKWNLPYCITRNKQREQQLYNNLIKKPRYWVIQQHASDVDYQLDTTQIDPDCQIVEILPTTDNIWDWLLILEMAEGMILIDSVFANIVDQMNLNPNADRYYVRKWNRGVDGNPVFLHEWTYLNVEIPPNYKFQQINPADEIKHKQTTNYTQPY